MDKNERWILRYLRKTNRLKTLKILEKDLISTAGKNICDSKCTKKEPEDKYQPVKLSFSIIKAPKRALNLDSVGVDTTNKTSKSRKEKNSEENKKGKMFKDYIYVNFHFTYEVEEIPKDFKKIAKFFGLPKDHLHFFYEHRESFSWEMKVDKDIHCTVCDYRTKPFKNCLDEHMINEHNFEDIPCMKQDCNFVAYSNVSMKMHLSKFHGIGKRIPQIISQTLSCKYSSCSSMFEHTYNLENHHRVHENRLIPCSFCPYRTISYHYLKEHLYTHFNIRNNICEICEGSFRTVFELNRHQSVKHGGEFTCVHCFESFPSIHKQAKHRINCKERLKKFSIE